MNDTIFFTIKDYEFLNQRQKTHYLQRYQEIKEDILNSERIQFIKEDILGVLNNIYLDYWRILGDKFGELSERHGLGLGELDRRLPNYVEELRRIERHVGMNGEQYRVYPYQLRNLQNDLIEVMRELGAEPLQVVGDSQSPVEEIQPPVGEELPGYENVVRALQQEAAPEQANLPAEEPDNLPEDIVEGLREFPYLDTYMGERYPDGNWRENRRLYRVIRGFITTERRLAGNNEILAERYRDFVNTNPEWRNSLRARRNLRRMRGGANNSSNGVDRFADTKSEGHLVDESIIEELKYFFYRTRDTSLFVDKSRRRWKNPNIYTLYNLLSPSNEVNIDEFKAKINFRVPPSEERIIIDSIDNYTQGLSEDDMARLDAFVAREYGREGVSFLDIIPDHHTFLVKLLEYWSGSMKIADRSYSVHYRRGLVALESHTCFNQLVIPNIDSKVEFLELFLKSLLNVGTGFGVAGRQIRRRRIGKTKTKPLKKIKKTKRERVKKNKSRKNKTKKNEKVVKIGRFSIRTKKLK